MNRSLRPVANPLPGAGLWWRRAPRWRSSNATCTGSPLLAPGAGVPDLQRGVGDERALHRRSADAIQWRWLAGRSALDLVLYLGIGTVVWAYLRAVFANVGEMVAWERWEGTIEYTMMAPISRLAHMLGVSLFSIIYGLARSALLLGVLALFFSVDLSNANPGGAALILLVGSVSFLGFGIMAAVLPLLFPERGEEMTFVISSILLLVSVSITRSRFCRTGWSRWRPFAGDLCARGHAGGVAGRNADAGPWPVDPANPHSGGADASDRHCHLRLGRALRQADRPPEAEWIERKAIALGWRRQYSWSDPSAEATVPSRRSISKGFGTNRTPGKSTSA